MTVRDPNDVKQIWITKIQDKEDSSKYMNLYVAENFAGNIFYQSSDMYDTFGSVYDINQNTKDYLNNGYQEYYDWQYDISNPRPEEYEGVYYAKQLLRNYLDDNPQIAVGSNEYYGLWIDCIEEYTCLTEYSELVSQFIQTVTIIAGTVYQGVVLVKNIGLLVKQSRFISNAEYTATIAANNTRINGAKQAQLSVGYAADDFSVTVLKKGSKVYGLRDGQSAWYTTKEMVEKSGYDTIKIYEGLQVAPSPSQGYRTKVGEYLVKQDVIVPTGRALNNTYYNGVYLGSGGYTQFYIAEYESVLELLSETALH